MSATLKPGDVVIELFRGAMATKRRPAVIVSTDLYHSTRPDVVLGLLTTQIHHANSPTDFVLLDWSKAGLHQASAFRAYFQMADPRDVNVIGRLTDRDWQEVQARLRIAIAVT